MTTISNNPLGPVDWSKTDWSDDWSMSDCSICFVSVDHKKTDAVLAHTSTPSNSHFFHRECLINWIRTSGGITCPNCRDPVTDPQALDIAQKKLQERSLDDLMDTSRAVQTIVSASINHISLLRSQESPLTRLEHPPIPRPSGAIAIARSLHPNLKTACLVRLAQLIAINGATYKLIEEGTCSDSVKYLRKYDLAANSPLLLVLLFLIPLFNHMNKNTSDLLLFKKIVAVTLPQVFLAASTTYLSYRVLQDDCGEESQNMALILTTVCAVYAVFLACRK